MNARARLHVADFIVSNFEFGFTFFACAVGFRPVASCDSFPRAFLALPHSGRFRRSPRSKSASNFCPEKLSRSIGVFLRPIRCHSCDLISRAYPSFQYQAVLAIPLLSFFHPHAHSNSIKLVNLCNAQNVATIDVEANIMDQRGAVFHSDFYDMFVLSADAAAATDAVPTSVSAASAASAAASLSRTTGSAAGSAPLGALNFRDAVVAHPTVLPVVLKNRTEYASHPTLALG
jgi:hypothetical protein